MNPFWNGLFEHFKKCGRDATLFVVTLAGLFGLLTVGAVILQTELGNYALPALPWIGLAAAVWMCLAIRRTMARRREGLQRRPLSDDELFKARCKLVRNHK